MSNTSGNARRRDLRRLKGKIVQQEWQLQEAKARFSEVFRLAPEHDPQRVIKHGREVVIVITAEEYTGLAQSEARKGASPNSLRSRHSAGQEFIWTGRATSEETSDCERLLAGHQCDLRTHQVGTQR